jgi:hypothetical protein
MITRSSLIAAGVLFAGLAASPAFATNIALFAPVTVSDPSGLLGQNAGWGGGILADPSTITQGDWLPIGTQWNTNTVYWSGSIANSPVITINLGSLYNISSINLEADNNDTYRIAYQGQNNIWTVLADINPNRSWGLDMGSISGLNNVFAKALSISAIDGDGQYAVARLEAIGTTPLPAALPLFGSAILCLGALAQRKRKSATA